MIPPPSLEHWLDNLMLSVFAAFAGFLGYLMRTVDGPNKVSWPRSLLEGLSSGIIGFLTVLVCRALGLTYEWMGFSAGVLGWMGAKVSIQLLERLVLQKLGLEVEKNADD